MKAVFKPATWAQILASGLIKMEPQGGYCKGNKVFSVISIMKTFVYTANTTALGCRAEGSLPPKPRALWSWGALSRQPFTARQVLHMTEVERLLESTFCSVLRGHEEQSTCCFLGIFPIMLGEEISRKSQVTKYI